MRKRIINFLYSHRILRVLIPVFHYFIGGSRFRGNRQNEIQFLNAHIYKSRIVFKEVYNNIYFGSCTDFHHSDIIIKGKNNQIYIGDNCYINGLKIIIEGDNNQIYIGDRVFMLDDVRFYVVDGSRLSIGCGCMFSDHIELRTTDNHSIFDNVSGMRINYEKNIVLHENVWVGMHVIILKGVELAHGCIVGAGSVVTKGQLTPMTIIAGNPAKQIKENIGWTMERYRKK